MRWIIPVSLFALSACSIGLPGRQTLAPMPQAPDVQSIAATQAFAGRLPLVTIAPGTADFAAPLKGAVAQALAIKPAAAFEVRAVVPQGGQPDADAKALGALLPLAGAVARAVAADDVQPGHVTLTAGTGGGDAAVLVYVK
ncbi:hypothetical protein [Acidocella sp.]|uniref:hypothetical protein n=1 Tax=Acidocella sp. TaxID=50710 RepID=UPI002621B284|nr:hypothetical protein [Acidocella sp.]